jgi:hypothetical protein
LKSLLSDILIILGLLVVDAGLWTWSRGLGVVFTGLLFLLAGALLHAPKKSDT